MCEYSGGTGPSVGETPRQAGAGGGAVAPAPRTLQGYKAIPLLRNGQREGVTKGDGLAQNHVINQLFGLAAYRALGSLSSCSHEFLQHNPSE
jgi:hypothetical protein